MFGDMRARGCRLTMAFFTRYRSVSRTPQEIMLEVYPRKTVQLVTVRSSASSMNGFRFSSGMGSPLAASCRGRSDSRTVTI